MEENQDERKVHPACYCNLKNQHKAGILWEVAKDGSEGEWVGRYGRRYIDGWVRRRMNE